jgi:hypothetical protein
MRSSTLPLLLVGALLAVASCRSADVAAKPDAGLPAYESSVSWFIKPAGQSQARFPLLNVGIIPIPGEVHEPRDTDVAFAHSDDEGYEVHFDEDTVRRIEAGELHPASAEWYAPYLPKWTTTVRVVGYAWNSLIVERANAWDHAWDRHPDYGHKRFYLPLYLTDFIETVDSGVGPDGLPYGSFREIPVKHGIYPEGTIVDISKCGLVTVDVGQGQHIWGRPAVIGWRLAPDDENQQVNGHYDGVRMRYNMMFHYAGGPARNWRTREVDGGWPASWLSFRIEAFRGRFRMDGTSGVIDRMDE